MLQLVGLSEVSVIGLTYIWIKSNKQGTEFNKQQATMINNDNYSASPDPCEDGDDAHIIGPYPLTRSVATKCNANTKSKDLRNVQTCRSVRRQKQNVISNNTETEQQRNSQNERKPCTRHFDRSMTCSCRGHLGSGMMTRPIDRNGQ